MGGREINVDVATSWPPNWTDAVGPMMGSYSSPDAIIERHGTRPVCAVSDRNTRFVMWFWPPFMVFFMACCWFGIEDLDQRVAFMILGVFWGIATFALIYGIFRYHEQLGPYLIADQATQKLSLPRYKRELAFADLICFQWFSGLDRNEEVVTNTDLNLLANCDSTLERFHLMGNPAPEIAREMAAFIGEPLIRTQCPAGYYRSSDAKSVANVAR